ncbi:hypothetical protein ALQ17_01679 [Pseudomonas fluorescens]|nr:hypothetical protein ALQ17_01679 [Pseudomonas fluorescens]
MRAGGKQSQLNRRLQQPHQVRERFAVEPFGPIDDALEDVVEQLIGHVAQHQLSKPRDEGCNHHQQRVQNGGGHIDERIPPRPAGVAVHGGGGDRQGAGVVEDFVQPGLIEEYPRIAHDRDGGELQLGVVGGFGAPRGQTFALLTGVPGDFLQALAEVGEKRPEVLVGHEATEERLVVGGAQLSGEFLFEGQRRAILLERVFRVVGHIGHQASHAAGVFKVWCKQQDAGQRRTHHAEFMAQHRIGAEAQAGTALDETLYHLCVIVLDILPQPCQLQRCAQGGFLAGVDLGLQRRAGDRAVHAQPAAQVAHVTGAQVEVATQLGEGRDRQLVFDRRQGVEPAGGVGTGDVSGGRFISVRQGFLVFEVVQCGVEQRYGPGAGGARAHRKPGDGQRDVQADKGRFHVQLKVELLFQGVCKQGFAERLGILEILERVVDAALGLPMCTVQLFEGGLLRGVGGW